MKMNKSLTVGQIISLNHILTEYPMNFSLDTIFNMIHLGDKNITLQEHFCNWDISDIYTFISSLSEDIDKEIELAMR